MLRPLLIALLALPATVLHAGRHHHKAQHANCSHAQGDERRIAQAKPTQLSEGENAYDVKHVKLDLEMGNSSTYLSGSATTTAQVVFALGLTEYAFELDSVLTIDSVIFNGASAIVVRNGDLGVVYPAAPLNYGDLFTCQVFYHGQPPAGSGLFTDGVNHATVGGTGTQLTYTISDQFLAKDWWPSKQSLTDKIDSADLWFTVADGLKAGSNGLLKAVMPMAGGKSRYQWKTNYPIDYYLIAVAIGPYAEHRTSVHYTGSADTTLVQSYVYDSATLMPAYQPLLDAMPEIIDHFSALFGRYPFWQEKYGQCIAPLGGGMEHQTMTFAGLNSGILGLSTLAHELGHQWWGDCVTYTRWRDIWMSEGWATYSEHLYREKFVSAAAAKSFRSSNFVSVMSNAGGSLMVPDADTMDASRVFDYRLTYQKGASVAHMLRYEINDDTLFFQALRNYQSEHAFGVGSTEDFKNSVEATTGLELDTFFTQWVDGEGYPKYTGSWNQVGNTVMVQLNQTGSKPTATPLFMTPLEIRLISAAGDTVIRTRTNAATQLYTFEWGGEMTGFSLDPNDHILNKASAFTKDPTLGLEAPWAKPIRIAPNPAKDSWVLSGAPAGVQATLLDIAGHVVFEGETRAGSELRIPAGSAPVGNYLLRLTSKEGGVVVRKLAKQ